MLENLEELNFTFMYENKWHSSWPISSITARKIPTLIKLEFLINNRVYSWLVEPNISYASQY